MGLRRTRRSRRPAPCAPDFVPAGVSAARATRFGEAARREALLAPTRAGRRRAHFALELGFLHVRERARFDEAVIERGGVQRGRQRLDGGTKCDRGVPRARAKPRTILHGAPKRITSSRIRVDRCVARFAACAENVDQRVTRSLQRAVRFATDATISVGSAGLEKYALNPAASARFSSRG